ARRSLGRQPSRRLHGGKAVLMTGIGEFRRMASTGGEQSGFSDMDGYAQLVRGEISALGRALADTGLALGSYLSAAGVTAYGGHVPGQGAGSGPQETMAEEIAVEWPAAL